METIEELRASVHRDPRHAAEVATALVDAARADGDATALSRALALRGRARRSLGEIDLAESDLRHALDAAAAAPPTARDELAADAHLGLAGVLSFAGRSEESFAELDLVERLGSERLRAYAALQRAVVEQRLGRLARALAGYQAALPVLRRLDARLDLAMVLLNRGVIRTQTGECDAAVADLTEARELFAGEDHAFGVAQADHGLGWAVARRGDLPRALALLDRAAGQFHRLGHTALEVDVDRVEVLLAAGLHRLAQDLASGTARQLAAAGNHSQAAETWLLCARASLLDGDRGSAAVFAQRARALFAEQSAPGWERAARLELHLCGERPTDPAALATLADELAELGNARGAAVALASACVAACETGDQALAGTMATRAARHARRLGIFEVQMLATYAQARCSLAGGDLPGATGLVRSGLTGLYRHRSSLAAVDARAAVAVHASQLIALGLRMALARGSAAAVLEWMELGRTGRARHRPTRPPEDPALAADLARLRAVAAQVREAEADRRDTADLLAAQRDLERAIHQRQLRTAAGPVAAATGDPAVGNSGLGGSGLGNSNLGGAEFGEAETRALVATLPQLRSRLTGECLVAMAEIDGRLVAVRVDGHPHHGHGYHDHPYHGRAGAVRASAGSSRLVDLGSATALYQVAGTLSAGLRAAASRPDRPVRADQRERLSRSVAALDAAFGGLFASDRPDQPVVLVVPPALHAVAWSLLPSLAGRPVVVAPSATWWWQTRGEPPAHPGPSGWAPVPPLVVAGPGLTEAVPEAAGVAACYPGAVVLTGAAATSGAVLARLVDAPVAHFACHGRVRYDNPLWSALELTDGPLCAYDLEHLHRTPPLVVLSGCETGVGVRAGDELLGLSTALLRHGTRTLVAAVSALPDTAATRDTMIALHRRVAAGTAAPAVLAEFTASGVDDPAALAAAGLGCFGVH